VAPRAIPDATPCGRTGLGFARGSAGHLLGCRTDPSAQEPRLTIKSRTETTLERGLFAARWLLAPMYLGLVFALAMLLVVFLRELVHYGSQILTMSDEDVILAALSLIDISLAGNLVLIVLYSGYENFVSRLDVANGDERPHWMGTIDFSALKLKLIASIVAISAIHLLKWFIWIGNADSAADFDGAQVRWLVWIHLSFIVSGVLLALMDWIGSRTKPH
jgi:uncharacterized protein (TIGR00645 family)